MLRRTNGRVCHYFRVTLPGILNSSGGTASEASSSWILEQGCKLYYHSHLDQYGYEITLIARQESYPHFFTALPFSCHFLENNTQVVSNESHKAIRKNSLRDYEAVHSS